MTNQGVEQPEIGHIINVILLASLVIVLPGIQWSFFGWIHIFLPLLSFFLMVKYGGHTGKRLLLSAITISLIVFLLLKSFDLFIFSLALLLSGFVLYQSAERHDSPALSGVKFSVVLAVSWIAVLMLLSAGSDVSVYSQFLKTLDQGIIEALQYYRQSNTVSTETLIMLETTLAQMQVLVPMIMPSILFGLILMITWLTMVVGNILVLRTCGQTIWSSYRYWQLPEKLIWLVIIMGFFALIPTQPFRVIGINSLIVLSLIYCFQGLSIVVFFMNKWNVPLLLRSFFYVMIVFQSLGTLILLFSGIADIWFDFRKQRLNEPNKTE